MRGNRQRGLSLLELIVSMSIASMLFLLGSTLFSKVQSMTQKQTAELNAQWEALLMLGRLRSAYNIDLLDERDPPRRHIDSRREIKGSLTTRDGGQAEGIVGISTTIQAVTAAGVKDVFTFGNQCADVPEPLEDKLPSLSRDYFDNIFTREYQRFQAGLTFTDPRGCHGGLGPFQCGFNQTSYVEMTMHTTGRTFRVPADVAPEGSWKSSRHSAVAAFVCQTERDIRDQRQMREIALWIGVLNKSRRRIEWRHHDMILTPRSASDNAQFVHR